MSISRGLLLSLLLSFALTTFAETHNYAFTVQEQAANRLCKNHRIVNVNGQFPGPTVEVQNGDSVAVKVTNASPYNVTIHWPGFTPHYENLFTIQDQEGTLWWHAHSRWLRATVYGALVIRPKPGSSYPFPTPKVEFPVILGEWWDRKVISVLRQALFSGAAPNISDAITINGQPGDLFRCSSQGTTKLTVNKGDTVLLRVINAALNQQLFFSVANHKLTVVATDAVYTKQFTTNVIMVGPGQTTDVLLTADQQPGRYYMAARAYATAQNAPFDNTTATAILEYKSATTQPILPQLPAYNDTNTVTAFSNQIKSPAVLMGTRLYKLKFGSSVQIVLQDTSIFSTEDHPVHLHGYHFYIVGQGFGNFNPSRDTANFNLVDPPQRNTIDVPVGGWAAIRFVADNPGVWLMHCHIDTHLAWGFAMAFIVENGVGESETLLPPPSDLPKC
ncbi:laccase 3 [Tanacetum coccineum]